MFYILASLFCLFFTATSYCSSLWPAFTTSSLILKSGQATSSWHIFALAFLLCFIFIPLEAYLYHWFLKGTKYIQALRYAIAANITTLLTILSLGSAELLFSLLGFVSFLLVKYNIISDIADKNAHLIIVLTFSTLIEFIVMKSITDYPSKKLIVPVLSGYVLTIAILILGQLLFGLQK